MGYDIIIMGDESHPEVEGIVGFCKNIPYICRDDAALLDFLKKNLKNLKKKVAIVAQTTYNISIWEKCVRMINRELPDAEIYNTICSATADRQKSAVSLADNSDLMIVVGGKHSSNTAKLFEICKERCEACVLVANAS